LKADATEVKILGHGAKSQISSGEAKINCHHGLPSLNQLAVMQGRYSVALSLSLQLPSKLPLTCTPGLLLRLALNFLNQLRVA
jgi:hypothetical protein